MRSMEPRPREDVLGRALLYEPFDVFLFALDGLRQPGNRVLNALTAPLDLEDDPVLPFPRHAVTATVRLPDREALNLGVVDREQCTAQLLKAFLCQPLVQVAPRIAWLLAKVFGHGCFPSTDRGVVSYWALYRRGPDMARRCRLDRSF